MDKKSGGKCTLSNINNLPKGREVYIKCSEEVYWKADGAIAAVHVPRADARDVTDFLTARTNELVRSFRLTSIEFSLSIYAYLHLQGDKFFTAPLKYKLAPKNERTMAQRTYENMAGQSVRRPSGNFPSESYFYITRVMAVPVFSPEQMNCEGFRALTLLIRRSSVSI